MTRAAIPLAIFVAMAAMFWFVLMQMNEGEYNPRDVPTQFIGREAPAFSLPDLFDANQVVSSESMRGRTWILNIWGTWCPECWKEHDYLLHLAKRQQVPIIGINWRDDRAEAQAMLARLGNPFEKVGFDPQSDAVIDWGVYGAPETFLIDPDGIVRVKHAGAMTPAVWREKFSEHFNDTGASS
jgi:cytochrome c biogenesis protein CcmG/thiol:disulfide interchange protein DsbE